MTVLLRGVVALSLLVACGAVSAFGAKTHLWIGSQVLGELRNGCDARLASGTYRVAPDLCRAITSNAESFYAGVLGPDVYPDLISGQATTHSGVAGGWDSAEFLEHVVSSADTAPGRAYAAGYLVHAAGDVFGHSYVNAYAGDVWDLRGERTVELRHAVIEKYIDARLPPLASGETGFRAPAEFIRDTLVHNDRTHGQYRLAALHLASMTRVKATVDDLAARVDAITGVVPDVLAKSTELGITLAAQLVDGEAILALASAALDAGKSRAAAQQVVVDGERAAVADATAALEQHEARVAELSKEAQAQQQAAAAASAGAQQATAAAKGLRATLSELEAKIRTVPPKIVVNVCNDLTDQLCSTACPEGSPNPLCALCGLPRAVCSVVERVNDEYQRLNAAITDARQRLLDLEATAAEETEAAEAATANADALLEQRAVEAAAEPALAEARTTAAAAYRAADERHRTIASTVASLQHRTDELRGKVEQTRKRLVDARAIADQLRNLAAQLNLLAHLLHNWQRGIDHAGLAFVRAGDRVGQGLLAGRTHLFSEYSRWLSCEGAVYLAEPYQVADAPCSVATAAQRLQVLLHDLANVVLPDPLQDLHRQLDDLRARIAVDLRVAITTATKDLVRFVTDPATAEFVDLLMNPAHATRAKLDEVLATGDDATGKDLLVFTNGADLIDRDLGLTNGSVDPEEFAALSAAVTLAKLSLLDQAETRRLVLELGGPEAGASYDAGRFDVGRSILITAVRSLDGSEQWQPYGLLYPRSSGGGSPASASDRHYGFGPGDAVRHGLPLFIDPVLRQRVFLKLFPRQIHGELAKRPEMAPGRYAFPICDGNPFPVTFLPDGGPALADDRCPSPPPASGQAN